jgi:hypothetical protein
LAYGLYSSALVTAATFILVSSALANHAPTTDGGKGWRWEQLSSIFRHTPGIRWVYAVTGRPYPNGGELRVEVKGRQYLPHLKQDVLLKDEAHAATNGGAVTEVVPVLYYPRQGYLVRDTAHIYSNPQRTSLMSTGNLGEAAARVLPLWKHLDGTAWQPVDTEHWGTAANLRLPITCIRKNARPSRPE